VLARTPKVVGKGRLMPIQVADRFHLSANAYAGTGCVPGARRFAAACVEENRWKFLFVTAPLRLPGGPGSPVNPLAIF
jgi:hypothetical protein